MPDDGLLVGRSLVPDDIALDAAHFRVELDAQPHGLGSTGESRRIRVESEGTALHELVGVARQALIERHLPAVIVAGRSVFMLVNNIDAFERREVRRDRDLIVGGSTGRVIDAVEAAANAEDHVLILGPDHIAHPLARRYIAKVGPHAWFRPGGDQHLDHFLSTRPRVRSVVIDLSRVPPEHDLRSLVNLLETDLRFVITYPDGGPPTYLPDVLRAAAVTVPRWRSDETVIEIADAAAARQPHGVLAATSVAHLLHRATVMNRERWLRLLEVALRSWDGSEDALPIDEIARNM